MTNYKSNIIQSKLPVHLFIKTEPDIDENDPNFNELYFKKLINQTDRNNIQIKSNLN